MKLNPIALGLSGGITWGLCLFLTTLLFVFTGYGELFLTIVSGMYPGYGTTVSGSFVGLVYGFLDGFVMLFALAWIHNKAGDWLEKRETEKTLGIPPTSASLDQYRN